MPGVNRRVLLVKRPTGIPQPDDFAFDEAPIGAVGEGRFLVRNLFLSVDPAQRGWASEGTNYSSPVPLGGVMRALAVGQIVESRHADFPEGSYVYGWLGWQSCAVIGPEEVLVHVTAPRLPLSAYAGILGINGLTAYLALNRIGRPEAGETVVVSTAAGAVGSIVGQLARSMGCIVVGLTGDDAKVAICRDRFGYHEALNYKAGPIETLLAEAAPTGIDVFFDNVGGTILDGALRAMRVGGRVVQCGTASIASWVPPPTGLRNEREVLTRRLSWGGFVIFDHVARFADATERLTALIESGEVRYDEEIRNGIEAAPQALLDVYAGRNRGKMLVRPE